MLDLTEYYTNVDSNRDGHGESEDPWLVVLSIDIVGVSVGSLER